VEDCDVWEMIIYASKFGPFNSRDAVMLLYGQKRTVFRRDSTAVQSLRGPTESRVFPE
jgi:hypothetical protein